MNHLSGDRLPAALFTLAVISSVVGGMALVAVGVGLHGERPSSGRAAMVVTGIMAAIYAVIGAWLTISAGMWPYGLTAGLCAVATTVLFLFAAHSASVLHRYPPPKDQNVVTPEFLEAHRRQRDERRRRNDL